MEKSRRDDLIFQAEIRQKMGHRQRMGNVGDIVLAALSVMTLLSQAPCLAQKLCIRVRIGPDLTDQGMIVLQICLSFLRSCFFECHG